MIHQPFMIPTLIFLVVSIPLIAGVVPRNRLYGVRTRDTLADARVWYAVNRFAGTAVLLSNLVYWSVALWLPYDRTTPDDFSVWRLHLAAFAIPLAISCFVSRQYRRRLARRG